MQFLGSGGSQTVATCRVLIDDLLHGTNLLWRESAIDRLVRRKKDLYVLQLRLRGKIYTATGLALRHKRLNRVRSSFDKAATLAILVRGANQVMSITRELTKIRPAKISSTVSFLTNLKHLPR